MRKKKFPISSIQLLAVLLALMSIPYDSSARLKGMTVAILAPAWEQLQTIKHALKHVTDIKVTGEDGAERYANEEIHRLQLENRLLSNEVETLKETLKQEAFISNLIFEAGKNDADEALPLLKELHREDVVRLIDAELQSVPAKVIFRPSSSWSNSLWINVGTKHNEALSREVVAKNSPVVVGAYVVGVVDYVGRRQSRVRLITDSGLSPSVRAMRMIHGKTRYLAKGELSGSAEAVWRGVRPKLKGIGFNYDFPDSEGPARDLRTGEVIGNEQEAKLPIIQKGDTLITTGMDGVFPKGLQVAKVTKLHLLKEGDYSYEIEAEACIKNLDDLAMVSVLPPTGYDPTIQAPHIVR